MNAPLFIALLILASGRLDKRPRRGYGPSSASKSQIGPRRERIGRLTLAWREQSEVPRLPISRGRLESRVSIRSMPSFDDEFVFELKDQRETGERAPRFHAENRRTLRSLERFIKALAA